MGIHEWSYQSQINHQSRNLVPHINWEDAVKELKNEVQLGFDEQLALEEAHRGLNCDIHTVFEEKSCIECSACEDVCPMDCINFVEYNPESTITLKEQVLSQLKVTTINPQQEILVSDKLKRVI